MWLQYMQSWHATYNSLLNFAQRPAISLEDLYSIKLKLNLKFKILEKFLQ